MVELVDRASIELFRRDEFVARLHECVENQKFSRMAGSNGKCRGAPFQRSNATFKHCIGGVGDAGINIAEGLQPEK